MRQFAGKVAVITGGNAGIGRAAAIEFATQGAQVVVSARREKEGLDVIAELKALGGEAIFVKTDVSKARDSFYQEATICTQSWESRARLVTQRRTHF